MRIGNAGPAVALGESGGAVLGLVGQRRRAGGAGFAQQLKDVAAGELAGVVIGGGVAFSVEP